VSFSIGAMLVLVLLIGQALGLPEVEDPIPAKIGLGHLFALAGAGGVLGGISRFGSPPAKRERAVGCGTVAGFCFGVAVYCFLLFVQVVSAL
jgi:hypothetical protein